MQESLSIYGNNAVEMFMSYGPKLALALLTLFAGLWLIRIFENFFDKAMDRAKVEATLQRFLLSLVRVFLKILLIVSVVSMVGVETTSIIATLGAAGLAVGLALQGSLANFAGGVLILFFRPFKVGDTIEAQGFLGVVREIQIFNTILTTLDNQRVVIPNALLSNDCIKNVFAESTRRVDMTFGVSYADDLLHVRQVLSRVIEANTKVLAEPKPDIYVAAHADSSINFFVRVWANSEDYWPVYFDMHEKVKLAFDREGITIPFPQRDVHLSSPA